MRSSIPLPFAAFLLAVAASSSAFQIPSGIAPLPKTARSAPQPRDSTTREGPFKLGDQQYSVLFNFKVLSERTTPSSSAAKSTSTLAALQILDVHGNVVYHQDFSPTTTDQGFAEQLSATASLLSGDGGTALVIRFLARPTIAANASPEIAQESWLVFTIVSGHLTPLGAPLPVGHGSDITVGGAVAAVMTHGGIAVMPLASTAEVLTFRVWTGSFYGLVPVRFDWANGQWGQGEECYQTDNGTLTPRGCIMRLEAKPQPRSPDADTAFVRLFVAPDGNTDNLLNVSVSPDAHIEVLEMQAIVRWGTGDRRIVCSFSNVWLRVLINDQEGWVRGQDAFDALGLPLTNPQ